MKAAFGIGIVVGLAVRLLLPETWQLIVGVPAILVSFFAVLWFTGFTAEDRELFTLRKSEVQDLRDAEARDQIVDDVV